MSLDLTAATAVLKTKYTTDEILNIASSKHPFFKNLKKEGDFRGDGTLRIPVEYVNPQSIGGGGANGEFFSAVQASTASSSTQWATFTLTRKLQYGVAKVSGLAMIAGDGDNENAFFDVADREWNNMFTELGNRIAIHLYRSGTGSLGRRASIAGQVITLNNPRDARNWKKGMRLYASATDGGGTLRGAPDFTTVAAVNKGTGTVTVVAAGAIAGFVDNDFLFAAQGDYDGTYNGLEAWLPPTDPTATLFFGVDRTQDVTLLSGVRKTQVAGQTLEELAMDAATDIWDLGGMGTNGYLSPQNLNILAKQLGQKILRDQDEGATFGFPYIDQVTDGGTIRWVGDPDCPRTRMYILQQDTWVFHHAAEFPHFVEEDGNAFLRKDAEDAYETRARAWGNLGCRAPGYNAVVVLI